MRRKMKVAVLAAVAGTVLQFGGCLGAVLQEAGINFAADVVEGFIPFNVGDLFGGGTAG